MDQSNPQIIQPIGNSQSKSKNVLIVIIAIIITALFSGGGVFYWQQKNIKKTKVSMQKEIDELSEKNKKTEDELNKSKASSIDIFSPKQKAKKASIKSTMASAMLNAVICEDEEKDILSGNGGSKVCDSKNNPNWPKIDICGPNDLDTKWIVKNGNGSDWSISLDCKEFPDCNGAENAFCNASGCNFSGSCQ